MGAPDTGGGLPPGSAPPPQEAAGPGSAGVPPGRPALPFPFPALTPARVGSFHRFVVKPGSSHAAPAKARRAACAGSGVRRAGRAPRGRCRRWDASEMGPAEGFQGHLKKQRDLIMFRCLLTVQQVVSGEEIPPRMNRGPGGAENGRMALNMPNVRLQRSSQDPGGVWTTGPD